MLSQIKIRNVISQSGMSLIEMMIALTLGSIVTVGVVQLFVGSSQTYKLLVGQSRMQESARFGLSFIGRAVRFASYKGCFSTNQGVVTTLNPPASLPYEFDIRTGVDGFNSTSPQPPVDPGTWAPDMEAVLPSLTGGVYSPPSAIAAGTGIDTDSITPGTDILTTRNLSLNEAKLLRPPAGQTGPLVVNMPTGGLGFDVDHLAMISDCENATIFRVTDLDLNDDLGFASAGRATIGHDLVDTDIYRNSFLKLANVNSFDTIDAQVNAIETNIFYIAPGAGVNNLGNTPLSLWRKMGIERPVELVEGVENLQLMFGQDTDSDGAPNQYVPANMVVDYNEVVTLRINITVNSVDDVGSTSTPTHGCAIQDCLTGEVVDGLLRRTFTETIQLRNQG
jgi:type IV pilus assembly protein PilW